MAHIITRYNGTKVEANSFVQLAHRLIAETSLIDWDDCALVYDDLPCRVTAAVCEIEDEIRLWEVQ